jgi:hypothetical protein
MFTKISAGRCHNGRKGEIGPATNEQNFRGKSSTLLHQVLLGRLDSIHFLQITAKSYKLGVRS